MTELPRSVRIVEVGPRDGLQNEPQPVATATKLDLIRRLAAAGLTTIEATAFVSPKRVPQMADHAAVMQGIERRAGVHYPVLVPNIQGFEAALAAGARDIAVFTAASETFLRYNINCSIAESLERFRPVLNAAKWHGVAVRGYVSCALGCPYEGAMPPSTVASIARALHEMGCVEISLGDTIGAGTPASTTAMLAAVAEHVPVSALAGHFHDTWGRALLNIHAALQAGVRVFDTSVAGLGGCPYAPGASGNVATEDAVALFDALDIETGVDLAALCDAAVHICAVLGRRPASKVAQAVAARAALRCA